MNKYDRRHIANVRAYQRMVDQIFKAAAVEAAMIAQGQEAPEEDIFSFADMPQTSRAIDALQGQMATRLELLLINGISAEWALSNEKNDALCDSVLAEAAREARYYRTNTEARDAFLARKESGLTLSDRVWRYTDQFKEEMELGIDCGLREGLDAPAMARQLKQYLQHPDMLFRRVRDEHGNLQLSQRAAAFHPGQGVYRSSYKNARRLAATETNIAYRTADHERWQQLDFIVGIEVHLSNNHTCLGKDGKPNPFYDICDELKGKYPKDFKFVGWHPHCRCIATTILKTKEEMDADDEAILRGEEPTNPDTSENAVTELPDNFKQWMESNEERIARAKSKPYFLQDNESVIAQRMQNKEERLLSYINANYTEKFNVIDEQSYERTMVTLNEDVREVWLNTSDTARNVIVDYTSVSSRTININAASGVQDERVSLIDSVLDQVKTSTDIVVRSGQDYNMLKYIFGEDFMDLAKTKQFASLNKQAGRIGVNKAFMSTSFTAEGGFTGDIEFHIFCPKGTHMMNLWGCSAQSPLGVEDKWDCIQFPKRLRIRRENEILLHRNYRYQFIRIEEGTGQGGSDRIYVQILDRE